MSASAPALLGLACQLLRRYGVVVDHPVRADEACVHSSDWRHSHSPSRAHWITSPRQYQHEVRPLRRALDGWLHELDPCDGWKAQESAPSSANDVDANEAQSGYAVSSTLPALRLAQIASTWPWTLGSSRTSKPSPSAVKSAVSPAATPASGDWRDTHSHG